MNKRVRVGIYFLVSALAGAAGYYSYRSNPSSQMVQGAAERLMQVSLTDLGGEAQRLSRWRGEVLVVNFWATWCSPCREEIPALIRVQHKHASKNLKLVGIGIDDVGKIREYQRNMAIDYVLLVGGVDALGATKDLGNHNGVLPFTVVLDRNARVVFTHTGALSETALDTAVAQLL